MARKTWTKSKEQLRADPRHNSQLASKFINCIMRRGKKSTATRIFYEAMDLVAKQV